MNARSLLFLAILPLLAASSCAAQDESDALKLLLAHSDAVVTVTSVKSGRGMRSGANYVVESFKDVVTLAGEPLPATLTVNFERDLLDDPTPFQPGQRFILFLKRRHAPTMDVWELTDVFFGCQPLTKGLEGSVSAAAKVAVAKPVE